MARVAVVGAGIIGLACAQALAEDGHTPVVIDRAPDGDKCSWGNAGGIALPEIIPAARPGVLWRVPRWLLDPLGPLAIRPAHLPRMLPWLGRFVAAARPAEVRRITAALAALHAGADADLQRLLTATGMLSMLHRRGALAVYESAEALRQDQADWEICRRFGYTCREIDATELRDLEPALAPVLRRGVFLGEWSHVSDPRAIWSGLLAHLRGRGVAVLQREVTGLSADSALRFADGTSESFDRIVVAAGAWSAMLARQIGDRVLLESERGYNTTVADSGITLAREVIFAERKFVATPLSIGLRIGGAAEFAGLAAPPNPRRAARLLQLARRYLPALVEGSSTVWMGHRPATPDGLPVIGVASGTPRILYAFGHGHLGLTQAATTARLIADLVAERLTGLDLAPYSASRFGVSSTSL
jgi:D-amino-acid dehydrogenase